MKHRDSFLFLFLALIVPGILNLNAQQRLRSTMPEPDLEDNYQGHWKVQTDGGKEIYVHIKPNNIASHFYGLINDHNIYHGKWEIYGDALFIEWDEGYTYLMRPLDAQNFRFAIFNDGYTGSEIPDDEGLARKIPEGEVGKWAIPPDELDSRSSAREEAKGFFGNWEIQDPAGFTYYVLVNDDRTAASSYPRSRKGKEGLRGEWRRQGSELHIIWDTGHFQIIRDRPQDFVSELYPPASNLSDNVAPIPTFRVNEITATNWLDLYQSEEIFIRANPFRSRGDSNSFFRGRWILLDHGEPVQEVDVGRFGGIKIQNSNIEGNWRSTTDSIYFYWEDGHRAILSPKHLSFIYMIFSPGQPFDGTPTRIYPAVPGDPSKLEEFRKMKEDATLRMKTYREIQEEIRNQPIPQDGDRRKRQWWDILWPFGK